MKPELFRHDHIIESFDMRGHHYDVVVSSKFECITFFLNGGKIFECIKDVLWDINMEIIGSIGNRITTIDLMSKQVNQRRTLTFYKDFNNSAFKKYMRLNSNQIEYVDSVVEFFKFLILLKTATPKDPVLWTLSLPHSDVISENIEAFVNFDEYIEKHEQNNPLI